MKEEGSGGELGSDLDLDPDPEPWKILWIRIRSRIRQNDADSLAPDPDPQHCFKVYCKRTTDRIESFLPLRCKSITGIKKRQDLILL